MSGHRWAIPISANYSWFESIVDRQNPVDIVFMVDTVDAQPNQYAIVSSHLDDLDDIDAASGRAVALISLLDGAMYLQNGNYAGMYPREIIDLQAPGKALSEQMHRLVRRARAGRLDASPSQTSQPIPLFQLIARGDPPRGDDVRPLPAIAPERGGLAVRARHRHLP